MKVQFYGSLGEAIGREIELPVEAGITVADIRRQLGMLYPAAKLDQDSARPFLDDEMVGEQQAVAPEATLSFLPPLSGG